MKLTLDKRFWIAGGAVAAVLILVAGWFLAISPQLSGASSLRAQTDSARQQNGLLESRIATLKQQTSNLQTLTASLQAALDALPFDSGLPAFTRQISKQAAEHRIELTSVGVGSIGPAAAGTTPAAGPNSPAAGADASAAAAALYSIPITLKSTGSAKNQLAFLQAVRMAGPRRAMITSTELIPGAGAASASIDTSSTMTVQLTLFSAPKSPQAQAQLEKLLRGDVAS